MRPLVAALALIGAGVGVVASVACTSPVGAAPTATNTASTFTPVTGIEVDAQSLFFSLGCGTKPGQAYKYVVVVRQRTGTNYCQAPDAGADPDAAPIASSDLEPLVGAGVYDCFADAVFDLGGISANLGLTNNFDVDVDAYDAPTYAAQGSTIGGAVYDLTKDLATDKCPPNASGDRAALAQAANWTTTCTGTQQPQIQSMVACGPLVRN